MTLKFGAVLTSARLDSSRMVYLVTVAPLEERLTVTLEYERRIYLPLVLRSYRAGEMGSGGARESLRHPRTPAPSHEKEDIECAPNAYSQLWSWPWD